MSWPLAGILADVPALLSHQEADARLRALDPEDLPQFEAVYREWRATLLALPYDAYLVTAWWQELRQEAIEQADHRCQLCNSGRRLHVHHRSYAHRGQPQELDDLIVLCSRCHRSFHRR
jgi:HNH endonuclease